MIAVDDDVVPITASEIIDIVIRATDQDIVAVAGIDVVVIAPLVSDAVSQAAKQDVGAFGALDAQIGARTTIKEMRVGPVLLAKDIPQILGGVPGRGILNLLFRKGDRAIPGVLDRPGMVLDVIGEIEIAEIPVAGIDPEARQDVRTFAAMDRGLVPEPDIGIADIDIVPGAEIENLDLSKPVLEP